MKIGTSVTVWSEVNDSNTALAVGSGEAPVFGTPMMIALMEQAALKLAAQFLEPTQTTVGTKIEVLHVAATPVGMKVEATAVLTAVEGRLLTFSVTAQDERGAIGEGIQQRMVVDAARFLEKAEKKRIQ